ncbi:MAG TPA: DapH/DapD/GlmU-related protein, partial [Chloroflexota bacterium]|nr:DapH/DapD/GlmU-related protein [Chloroflexota bacterium]
GDGGVSAIVEEVDATPEQRRISEINSGLYCFDCPWLAANIGALRKSPKGEFYLTDMVAIAVSQGRKVRALLVEDSSEVLGVNDRVQLADADRVARKRICEALMAKGVTIVDPSNSYIGKDVVVGADTVIQPGTHLRGKTVIGERCEIGPNSILDNAQVGDDCTVLASVLEDARVEARVNIGPFSHLRPGAVIASGAKIGNYAEVKNSYLGEGVQMHHFSYMGDAEIGDGTNIGAGTITCNFDGVKKHKTRVGKRVFLGSDTMLRAPIELGDGARTGAGSVVTKNVPAGKLALGVPARIVEVKGQDDNDVDTHEGGESGG